MVTSELLAKHERLQVALASKRVFEVALAMSRLADFLSHPFYEKLNDLRTVYYRAKTSLFYRYVFGSMGSHCLIRRPLDLYNTRYMHLGNDVLIAAGVRLGAIISSPTRRPELRIGNNVNIEQNVHIICHSRILIGDRVTVTGHCAIVDVTHPYEDVHSPVRMGDRILNEDSFVEIGEGSFLGFGTIVMPNVRIGKYCIIGAGSCVTRDIPDYSIAVGSPARVVRYYDAESKSWIESCEHSNPVR